MRSANKKTSQRGKPRPKSLRLAAIAKMTEFADFYPRHVRADR